MQHADAVPYRVLEAVGSHGDPNAGNSAAPPADRFAPAAANVAGFAPYISGARNKIRS